MNIPIPFSYDMNLAKNFPLKDFLESKFYTKENQKRVYVTFESDRDYLLGNLQELADNLQVLRDHLKTPVSINISFRPKWYEASKGRDGTSQHCLGNAADIVAKGHTPKQVADAIEELVKKGKMKDGGLGRYSTFTHYDVRDWSARWSG